MGNWQEVDAPQNWQEVAPPTNWKETDAPVEQPQDAFKSWLSQVADQTANQPMATPFGLFSPSSIFSAWKNIVGGATDLVKTGLDAVVHPFRTAQNIKDSAIDLWNDPKRMMIQGGRALVDTGAGMAGGGVLSAPAMAAADTGYDWLMQQFGIEAPKTLDENIQGFERKLGAFGLPVVASSILGKTSKALSSKVAKINEANTTAERGITPNEISKSTKAGYKVQNGQVMPDIKLAEKTVEADGGFSRGGDANSKMVEWYGDKGKIPGRVGEINNDLDGLLVQSDSAIANGALPPPKIDWSIADSAVNRRTGTMRGTVSNAIEAEKQAIMSQWDGTLVGMNNLKKGIWDEISDARFRAGEGTVDPARAEALRAVGNSLKTSVENETARVAPAIQGEVARLNNLQGAYYDMGDSIIRKFGQQSSKTIAQDAGSAIKSATAGVINKVGPTVLNAASGLTSGASGAANAARTLAPAMIGGSQGVNQGPAELPPPPYQQDPFANGLPRDTSQWNMMAVNRFAQYALSKPPEVASIAQGLVQKFADALHQENKGKMQKIVADMAKLFPDAFQPGMGVDNKIFHPDDQSEYMNILMGAMRRGQVSPSFVAQQRDSFLDSNDNSILPVHPEVAKQIPNLQTNKPPMNGQPRQYGY